MMKNFQKAVSLITVVIMMISIMVLCPTNVSATKTTYYVDSVNGNDSNNGTSPSTAWKTLGKVNSVTFQPGDRILFAADRAWSGWLAPKGSGTNGNPIIIDMYGTGNRPVINTAGEVLIAFYLCNQQYWEINNLEITNLGLLPRTSRTGIKIEARDFGVVNHIYLRNIYVHDVNGDSVRKDIDNGGIYFTVTGNTTRTRFNDILIENCTVKDVNRTGISVGGSSWAYLYDNWGGRYPQQIIDDCSHTNVVIRNNYVENIGGDGIVPMFCNKPLVEYNVANNTDTTSHLAGQFSAAIWPWRCEDALFQFNEAYLTRYSADGQAFDCDYSNRTIYQYNYSHDNEGGFILLCGNESLDSIVRYNISQNDRTGIFSVLGAATGSLYNNTIYIGPGLNTTMFRNTGGGAYTFENNIFYNLGRAKNVTWQSSINYSNNCYYGYNNNPDDPDRIIEDPLFVEAGSGGTGINTVGGYQLTEFSPCINTGKTVNYNGGKDYWGNNIYYELPDIGAHEYQGPSKVWNDNSPNIDYYGDWSYNSNANDYNGDYHSSNTKDSYFIVRFTGTNVKLFGNKNDWCGKADVYVDGEWKATIDNYSSVYRTKQLLFDTGLLTNGYHEVKVVVLRQKNAASFEYYIDLDKVEVTQTPITIMNDNDPSIYYSVAWEQGTTSSDYNGDYRSSNTQNAYYEITFTGTNAKIYGKKNDWCGKADVYVDGVKKATIDNYSASYLTQQLYYDTGVLDNGTHTVMIIVLRQKNPLSFEYYIECDKVEILSP